MDQPQWIENKLTLVDQTGKCYHSDILSSEIVKVLSQTVIEPPTDKNDGRTRWNERVLLKDCREITIRTLS